MNYDLLAFVYTRLSAACVKICICIYVHMYICICVLFMGC